MRTWLREGLSYSKIHGTVLIKVENLDKYLEGFSVKRNEVDRVVDEVLSDL
jgi:hypothetical protein